MEQLDELHKVYLGKNPITGKEIRTTRRDFQIKKETSLNLARLQVEIESNGIGNRYTVKTYQELHELWMNQHKEDIRNTTEQRIRNYFKNQILPYFGKPKLDAITPTMCQKILSEWAKKYKDFQKVKSYTSQLFKYGILIIVIKDNPMERIVTPKAKNRKLKSEMTFIQEKNFGSFSIA